MKDDDQAHFRFKRGGGNTLLIACGALAREVIDLIEKNNWQHLDVACIPAKLHHRPQFIPEAVRAKLRETRGHYQTTYVLYGDCGTAGQLDKVLEEEGGIERIPGPHCFSFFRGNAAFEVAADDEITTFYLTDYFCQHFDKFVWEALGLDKRESMLELVFGNYEKVLFMPQKKNAQLEQKARAIAARLGLKYEYRFCGYGDMEPFMGDC